MELISLVMIDVSIEEILESDKKMMIEFYF